MKPGLRMLRCRDASELLSRARERELTALQRIALGMHLAICVHCRRFGRQVELLGKAFRETRNREI